MEIQFYEPVEGESAALRYWYMIFPSPKAEQRKPQLHDFVNVSETLIWKLSATELRSIDLMTQIDTGCRLKPEEGTENSCNKTEVEAE